MKYHISIHISPFEIDDYQTFIHQLNRNLDLLNNNSPNKEIIFTPCLTISDYFYDWNNSKLNKDFFINKFNILNNIISSKIILDSIINTDEQILGALSFKRFFIEKYKDQVDAFIWFDSDLIFPDDLLFYLINSFELLDNKEIIITPQIPKMWDFTWDVLVNEKFINTVPDHNNYFNFDSYSLHSFSFLNDDKNLIQNTTNIKFASGWGNLISSELFKKYISYPDSFGHYGIDDTYAMMVLDIYKNKGNNIQQYILNNIIVSENIKYKLSLYKDFLKLKENIKTKDDFRKQSESEMLIKLKQLETSL